MSTNKLLDEATCKENEENFYTGISVVIDRILFQRMYILVKQSNRIKRGKLVVYC